MLNKLFNGILDFLFPPKCMWCGAYGLFICSQCFLWFRKRRINCIEWNNLIKIFAPFEYYRNNLLRKLIKDVKYHFHYWETWSLIYPMSTVLFDEFHDKNIILIPVPLHWRRKIWRWFNQAEILSNLITWDCINRWFFNNNSIQTQKLLKRVKNTKPQAWLSKEARLKNLEWAFVIKPWVEIINTNSILILIDDVCTTGETLERCAKELSKKLDNKIYWLVIASDR